MNIHELKEKEELHLKGKVFYERSIHELQYIEKIRNDYKEFTDFEAGKNQDFKSFHNFFTWYFSKTDQELKVSLCEYTNRAPLYGFKRGDDLEVRLQIMINKLTKSVTEFENN